MPQSGPSCGISAWGDLLDRGTRVTLPVLSDVQKEMALEADFEGAHPTLLAHFLTTQLPYLEHSLA
jgi:hypothetical protein